MVHRPLLLLYVAPECCFYNSAFLFFCGSDVRLLASALKLY